MRTGMPEVVRRSFNLGIALKQGTHAPNKIIYVLTSVFKKKRLKKSLSPNKIIGVQEIQRFLSGDLDQKNLIELMNIKTRQYAKRQKTWSRAHMSDWHMIYSSNSSILLKKILNLVS